jgi:hypothetical protein
MSKSTGRKISSSDSVPTAISVSPLSSIVFKKVNDGNTEVFSGLDAAIKRGYMKPDEEGVDYSRQVGECPYCHQPISVLA